MNINRMTDTEKLAAAKALDRMYGEAEAFHARQAPTRRVYKIMWDTEHACGSFPEIYEDGAQAEAAAIRIEEEMIAQDIWDESCGCEVIEVEIPLEGQPDEEAAWYEELNRGYARDRI